MELKVQGTNIGKKLSSCFNTLNSHEQNKNEVILLDEKDARSEITVDVNPSPERVHQVLSPTLENEHIRQATQQIKQLKEKNQRMQVSISKMQKICDEKIVNDVYQKKQELVPKMLKTRSTESLNEDLEHITIDDIFGKKKLKKPRKTGDIKKISPWGTNQTPD